MKHLIPFNHMQFKFSSRERRLVNRAYEAERPAYIIAEKITEASQQVELGDQEKGAEILAEAEPFLAESLEAVERAQIYESLSNLAVDVTEVKLTALIESMQKKMKPEEVVDVVKPVAASVPAEATKAVDKSKWERTKDWTGKKMEQVGNNLDQAWEWSKENPGKTALIATATIGALSLLMWLRRGSKKEKAQKGSKWSWLKWVPVVGVLGYGVYKGHQYLNNNFKTYADAMEKATQAIEDLSSGGKKAIDTAGTIAGGAKSGAEKVTQNFNESFEGAGSNTSETLERERKGEFESPEQYYSSLFGSLILDGCTVVFSDGICYVTKSGKQILASSLEVGLGLASVTTNFLQGNETYEYGENFKQCVKLYAETGVIYAASFAVLDFAWLSSDVGIKKGFAEALKRSAFWPYEVYRKTGLKLGVAALDPGAGGVVVRTEIETTLRKPRYAGRRIKYGKIGSLFGTWEEANLDSLFKEWQAYERLLQNVDKKKGTSLLQQTLDHRWNRVEANLKKGINSYYKRTGKQPTFLLEIGDSNLTRQIDRGHIDPKHFRDVLQKGSLPPEKLSTKTLGDLPESMNSGLDSQSVVVDSSGVRVEESGNQVIHAEADEVVGKADDVVPDEVAGKADDVAKVDDASEAVAGKVGDKAAKKASALAPDTIDEGGTVRKPSPVPNDVPATRRPDLTVFDPDNKLGAEVASSVDDAADATKSSELIDITKGDRVGQLMSRAGVSDEAIEVLKVGNFDLSDNLVRVVNESPEFATALAKHIGNSDSPADAVKLLNEAFTGINDPKQVTRMAQILGSEKKIAKALSVAEKGGDVAKSFSKMAKIGKALNTLGVVGDTVAIWAAVNEMRVTNDLIEKSDNEEMKRLYYQRYGYQTAEIGVSGAGLVTFGMATAGVGGAVATPVAIATVPISVVLYGAYEGHKWKEDKTRTVDDWVKERDVVELITDLRSYDVGERVGHGWDASTGQGNWINNMVPGLQMYNAFSGNWKNDVKRVMADLNIVNRDKIRAIVAHTTSVSIPEAVMDTDGSERNLTPEEAQHYKDVLYKYVENRTTYIMSKKEDLEHAIGSGANVRELMENSEYYALRMQDEDNLEEDLKNARESGDQKTATEIEQILDQNAKPEDVAKRYKTYKRKKDINNLYAHAITLSIYKESDVEQILQQSVAQEIQKRADPILVDFRVNCAEENFVDWQIDGSESQQLLAYLTAGYQKILADESMRITKIMLEKLDAAQQGKNIDRDANDELTSEFNAVERNLERHFLIGSPRNKFDELKANKAQYERVQEVIKKQADLQRESELIESLNKKLVPSTHVDYNKQNQKMWRNMKRLNMRDRNVLEEWLRRNPLLLES
ncbi:hypothetical protein KKF55_06260 [Patescibacteria group bacterium]|nr:hypothetical protein [Patescibacteria group bacterium]